MTGSIMTFNIRYDNNYDGVNGWANRKPYVFEMINSINPDIICLQEVLPHVKDEFDKTFNQYNFCGCGRSKELADEYNPIGYKRDLFDLLYSKTFWLSETPEVFGSMSRYSVDLPRICTQVILKHKTNNNIIRIYNTHLDHMSPKARILGLDVIFAKMKTDPYYPTLLTGDFNAVEDSEELAHVKLCPVHLNNISKLTGQKYDYTYMDFIDKSSACKIDYIFASDEFALDKFELIDSQNQNLRLSDHYPCFAKINL